MQSALLSVILTGANDEQFKQFGLDTMPYEVFTLKHNPDKTDPTYFTTMLNYFDLTIKEVIYFEHAKAAVASAQSVGIVSFYYDEAIQDLATLKHFLTENL